MKNRWFAIAAVTALAAAPLLIPAAAVAQETSSRADREQQWSRAELERIQRRVEDELRRAQEEVRRHMAGVQAHQAAIARAAQESAARAQEELRRQLGVADAQYRSRAVLAVRQAGLRAQQQVERALREAQGGDVFVWASDENGWLGVTVTEVTAEKVKEAKLPAERGVVISEVEAESPAAKAGLKSGDVITELNGVRIEGTEQFRRMIRETPSGRSIQLTVWRDGRAQTLSAQLSSPRARITSRIRTFPRDFELNIEPRLSIEPQFEIFSLLAGRPILGVSIEDVSGQLGNYFGAPDGEGVLIRAVNSGSPAEKGGLKAGDVIVKVAGERVRNSSELRAKLREKREQKTVAIGVVRKGAEMSFNVEVEQPKPPERRTISRRVTL